MATRKQDSKMLHRSITLRGEHINEEARTVSLAFSSETDQVTRLDGVEILDHGADSIRLDRLKNKAPLLMDHDASDQVGVVESISVGPDRVARAVVRFGRSTRASEVFNDVVDGIRSKVSVGYMIHQREDADRSGPVPVYRVTDWEPYEVSIVSIPADDAVGVARVADTTENQPNSKTEEKRMSKEETQAAAPQAATPAPTFDADAERAAILASEMTRSNEIRDLGKRRDMIDQADEFIRTGKSVESFRAYVLDNLDAQTQEPAPHRHANVDMTNKDHDSYSVVRAMSAASSGDWSGAGLEREVSDEIGKQFGRTTSGVFIPTNLRHTPEMLQQRAALEATTDGAGGYTVQTDVSTLIDMLRNKMMVRQMGAQVLGGLIGDLSFPRQATGSSFTWVAETPGSDVADSDATFEQVLMSPKTGQSSTSYSRQLLAQSTVDVEMFVRNDLTSAAALGIDLAAINGSGASNQPEGILNVTGIGSVAGGTNGLAPAWSHIVDLESAVAVDNADIGAMGYLTNAAVRGALKQTEKATGTAQFIWENGAEGFGSLNGYRAGASNQVPSNLTKGTSSGVCSAIIFGNWNDLLIGEWGAIEILVDPYRLKKQGLIEVTSFAMADIAVRHPESFAAMVDALTA